MIEGFRDRIAYKTPSTSLRRSDAHHSARWQAAQILQATLAIRRLIEPASETQLLERREVPVALRARPRVRAYPPATIELKLRRVRVDLQTDDHVCKAAYF